MLELISSAEDLADNITKYRRYLLEGEASEDMKLALGKTKVWVANKVGDEWHVAPVKVVGYMGAVASYDEYRREMRGGQAHYYARKYCADAQPLDESPARKAVYALCRLFDRTPHSQAEVIVMKDAIHPGDKAGVISTRRARLSDLLKELNDVLERHPELDVEI
jgi:hypothetical protein